MERLTERLGDYNNPKEICAVWVKNHDYVSAAHRLADYEDIADTVGGFDRLRELAEADKGGRLEVLPCKVGDTAYEVTSRKTISEYRVKAIRVELFCIFIEWDIVAGFVDKSIFGVPVDEIGKTVFLTREEAEKALEAMTK